jgi:hypothetical protein
LGVKNEPTPEEIALQLGSDADRFLSLIGLDNYLALLRRISVVITGMVETKQGAHLKSSRFLVGFTHEPAEEKTDAKKEKEKTKESSTPAPKYILAKADEIFLVDDTSFQHLFSPLR